MTQQQNQYKYYDKSTIPAIAGFMGGAVSTTLLIPLDIVKLRLQVNESKTHSKKSTTFRSLRIMGGIIKYEGIFGLYQGWIPAFIGSSVSWGGYFYFYEQFKHQLVQYKLSHNTINSSDHNNFSKNTAAITKPSDVLTSLDHFILAISASSVMVAITNPIWLVKTRIQLQLKRAGQTLNLKPYNGMIDAFRTIVQEEGIMALYKGIGPAFLLTSHAGVQFSVYEALRKQFHYSKFVLNTTTTNDNNDSVTAVPPVWQRLQMSAGYLTIGAISKLYVKTLVHDRYYVI